MMDWLILTAANVLKGSIVGGLSLLSWGIHTFGPSEMPPQPAQTTVIVVACDKSHTGLQAHVSETLRAVHPGVAARHLARVKRHLAMLRLEELVPPIRVEAIYSPDLLSPPSVLLTTPPLPPEPPTASTPAPAASRAT